LLQLSYFTGLTETVGHNLRTKCWTRKRWSYSLVEKERNI